MPVSYPTTGDTARDNRLSVGRRGSVFATAGKRPAPNGDASSGSAQAQVERFENKAGENAHTEGMLDAARRVLAAVDTTPEAVRTGLGRLTEAGLNVVPFEPGAPCAPATVLETGADAGVALHGVIYNLDMVRKRVRQQGECPSVKYVANTPHYGLTDLTRLDWGAGGDAAGVLHDLEGMYALIVALPGGGIALARDPLGVKPLYIGGSQGRLVVGFDLKTVAAASSGEIAEFPPGCAFATGSDLEVFHSLPQESPDMDHARTVGREILGHLVHSVRACLHDRTSKSSLAILLSGGLSSTMLTSIAARFRADLKSVAIGVEDAPDLAYARKVAAALDMAHTERIITPDEVIAALPEVIFHVESFDPAVVRRGIVYHFAMAAAREAGCEFAMAGDGANALFTSGRPLYRAGQRGADRMGRAHGVEVHLPFLDHPALVELALRIAPDLKTGPVGLDGVTRYDKRILRDVALGLLPKPIAADVALRPGMRFGRGAGLLPVLQSHIQASVSAEAFASERSVAPGVRLRSREELLYFRIFREMFPVERLLSLFAGASAEDAATA